MDSTLLPFVFFSQPSKPGQLTVITKDERKSRRAASYVLINRVFSGEAILVVAAVGIAAVVSIVLITRVQRTSFTIHMAWDVIYG